MRKETIENVVGIMLGDVWVDVNIRFREMTPPRTVEEKLAVEKVNSDLGTLAHEIKQEVKEKINKFFTN